MPGLCFSPKQPDDNNGEFNTGENEDLDYEDPDTDSDDDIISYLDSDVLFAYPDDIWLCDSAANEVDWECNVYASKDIECKEIDNNSDIEIHVSGEETEETDTDSSEDDDDDDLNLSTDSDELDIDSDEVSKSNEVSDKKLLMEKRNAYKCEIKKQ